VPPILPRFDAFQQKLEAERQVAQAILEADDFADGHGSMPLRRSADGHNPLRLRGLPAIGPNVTGATVHTDPVWALLAKDRRGDFHPTRRS
jgi:hypothetical protein